MREKLNKTQSDLAKVQKELKKVIVKISILNNIPDDLVSELRVSKKMLLRMLPQKLWS